MAMEAASAVWAGVPPASSTMAAAAMAAAAPVSAWQPPSAPASVAPCSMTRPTAAAVSSAITQLASLQPRSSRMERTAAGRMPHEPAVGAATTRPMAALSSETASARCTARATNPPATHEPARSAWRMRWASPPVRPLVERRSAALPGSTHSSMTCSRERMRAYSSAGSISMARACWASTTCEMGTPARSAASTTPERFPYTKSASSPETSGTSSSPARSHVSAPPTGASIVQASTPGSASMREATLGPTLPSTSIVMTATPPRACRASEKSQILAPQSASTSVTAAMRPGTSR